MILDSRDRQKKLTYILNKYSAKDATHFAHIGNLLEALAERGIKIRLLIEKADTPPMFHSPLIEARVLNSSKSLRYLSLIREIRNAIRDDYSTIFVRISSKAGLLAALLRRLYKGQVFFWQSGTTLEFDRDQPWSMKKLRWLFTSRLPVLAVQKLSDFIVTGPESMIDYYATIAGISRRRLKLLYNDIDLRRFEKTSSSSEVGASVRRTLNVDSDTTLLLCVHRLSPVRRSLYYFPFLTVELAKSHPERKFVCVVAGAGPELPSLQDSVAAVGQAENYRFLGDIPNSKIQELYWAADIFIQASYNEGFPRVLLEAMASGLPVVSTNAGGTTDIVGAAQRRFVVDRDDRQALAEVLSYLVEHRDQQIALSNENLATVRRFSTPQVAAMYDEVLFT